MTHFTKEIPRKLYEFKMTKPLSVHDILRPNFFSISGEDFPSNEYIDVNLRVQTDQLINSPSKQCPHLVVHIMVCIR